MDKHEIAGILEEMALLLELKGENQFKVRAYHMAGRALNAVDQDLGKLIDEERLSKIAGIGSGIAEKIAMLYREGDLPAYDQLLEEVPEGLRKMLNIPSLGAKKIRQLNKELKIETLEELKAACQEGKVRALHGFGPKTEETILDGIEHLEQYIRRTLWWKAWEAAEPIVKALSLQKEVIDVRVCGSLRRKLETVGDVDLLVSSLVSKPVMDWFVDQNWTEKVIQKGPAKSSIRLHEGMQVDLRVVEPGQFPFALHYFTGSKEHNIKVRRLAREHGFSLNEYGLHSAAGKKAEKIHTEETLFQTLAMDYIPPELREDLGEIEAAQKGTLPDLITVEQIKGAFHCHTMASDGRHTLEEMVDAAENLGWEYIGISDHSKSSAQAGGLDEVRLQQQIREIKELSKKKKIYIFSGTECDIHSDGSLDFNDELLKQLDCVIVSVHRGFKQDEATMTKRLIKAIEHPHTHMVGHLTGRLLLRREPYKVNIEKVIDAAIANGKIIELNANPFRLDMDWRFWHKASDKGLVCSINPDAHHTDHLHFIQAGVNVARKGWLTKEHVLNAWPLKRVRAFLERRTAG